MRKSLLSASLLVGLSILSVSATPALAAPEWGISLEHHNAYGAQQAACPTGKEEYFVGEPEKDCGVDPFTGSGTTFAHESGFNEYRITVSNTGDATSSGPVSVADQLPPGIALAGTAVSEAVEAPGWTCTVEPGATGVECLRFDGLAPEEEYEPIQLHVHVTPAAPEVATDVASVSGGDASTVTADDPTAVGTVPFGIANFTTSVTDALGDPFSQAGGHPFAASTELVLDSVSGDTSNGALSVAGGGAKSIEVELPPGFIGDPQASHLCPVKDLQPLTCPANTAVGYTQVSVGIGGKIVAGQAQPFPALNASGSSLVYALQPTPGHVAEFGFVISGGIPFILDASVRSNGDYGLTVGDDAIANVERPLATRLTFCSNGATKIISPSLAYDCNPVTPESAGFLTDPTHCGSTAAEAVARAVPWNTSSAEASKSVPTGLDLTDEEPNQTESFVTGCASAELAESFRTSSIGLTPETTQADSPTGVDFDLAVPQTISAETLATPDLRDITLTLPPGMVLSPSAGSGLEACSDSQFGVNSGEPGACPAASQIGTAAVFTPLLSASPTVEGAPKVAETQICSKGTSGASYSYQWLRNGVAISGATGQEYIPVEADQGMALQCQVTATNAGGSSVAVSLQAVVAPEPAVEPPFQQSRLAPPTGTPSVGNTVSCGHATWKGSPTFAYQWLRNGAPIIGAGSAEYQLAVSDQGAAVQCQVVATNAGGSVIADSEPVIVSPESPITPPVLAPPLRGKVFVGEPECSPCTASDAEQGRVFRLFLEMNDKEAGVTVKLAGHVSANPITGQLTATFKENPQLPFDELKLRIKGGPQAPLTTPQSCGEAPTTSDLTPWSSEPGIKETTGTPDAKPLSAFTVDWDGAGGACPANLPFNPSFLAQTVGPAAGTFAPLSVSFARPAASNEADERDEQDFAGITVSTPPGLLGKIAGVTQCAEVQANAGNCPQASAIGTTVVGAGTGSRPLHLGGTVYLTGPYNGAPFGLSIVTPAVAGPFNLGTVVVRASIGVNPTTGALTITSNPLPQIVDGVPMRLHSVRVDLSRPGFTLNPTSCAAQQITASITGEPVNNGEAAKTDSVSSQFTASNCAALPFAPSLSAQTQAKASKIDGTSLRVLVAQKPGEANIAKVDVQLPKQLPARLTTLQKACLAATFESNPAACPSASTVGMAVVRTPLLSSELTGPAILVSHGGAAFPDLEVVLQGEGITLILDGGTGIKKGVTYSRFETVPDAPISSFELNLPQSSDSLLAADLPASASGSFCGQGLVMPTTITGQNGKQIIQKTKITTGACTKVKTKVLTRAQKLAEALKACRTKYKAKSKKAKRMKCEKQARKKYGPLHKAKKKAKKSSNRNGKAGR